MKRSKQRKKLPLFLSLVFFLSLSFGMAAFTDKAYASSLTGGSSESVDLSMSEENLAALLEDLDADMEISDQDIHSFINEYLKKVENGEISVDGYSGEKIVNPELKMESGNDGMIRFLLPDGSSFEATLPNGMVSFEPVMFQLPEEVFAIVSKDGEVSLKHDRFQLTEPGLYQVNITFLKFGATDENLSSIYEIIYEFSLMADTINDISELTVPSGFQIASVKKDGLQLDITDSYSILPDGDGTYEIVYSNTQNEMIQICSVFELDTRAPMLLFSQDVTQGAVKGPVDFVPSEKDAVVYISYNGNREMTSTTTLSVPGSYTLEVFDPAGNRASYVVEIQQTWKIFQPKLIIMTLIIFIGVGLGLVFQRRDMKVL